MAVPKKRQGHARQAKRRANWKATVPAISTCPNCGAPRHPHTMCGVCGFYKDRVVLKALQNDDFTSPVDVADAEPAKDAETPVDNAADASADVEKAEETSEDSSAE